MTYSPCKASPEHAIFSPQVCQAIGVDPSDIQYVEAHGTGTVVGDSQELSAIDGLYGAGAGHTPEEPLLIGSVKSNMGHCEGCSGLAGVPSGHTTWICPLPRAAVACKGFCEQPLLEVMLGLPYLHALNATSCKHAATQVKLKNW